MLRHASPHSAASDWRVILVIPWPEESLGASSGGLDELARQVACVRTTSLIAKIYAMHASAEVARIHVGKKAPAK